MQMKLKMGLRVAMTLRNEVQFRYFMLLLGMERINFIDRHAFEL